MDIIARVSEAITLDIQDQLALLRMDDGKVNALSPTSIEALLSALDEAKAKAKALVLFGRPGCFSAGFDLRVMFTGPEAASKLLERGTELFLTLYEHPLPTIAAVSGHAIAGGVLLSACCDLRIGVSGEFKIGLNEIANGMPLPILAHELARARLDPRKFVQATLFARMVDAHEAVEFGWLDQVCEPAALEATVIAAASKLAKLPAVPYAHSKSSIRRPLIEHIRASFHDNLANLRFQ